MQTTLLGFAIAIILALVSALVAPLVIDWNRYRAAFEAEAKRLTGLAVHVNGSIDARILPSPRIKLHDVAVSEPGQPPQVQTDFVELEIRLGPLLRGEIQATELRLVAPQISVTLDGSGRINWPALSPQRSEALTISRFNIENGRLTLTDAASGSRLVLAKLKFDGDIRSFAGIFRGDGAFVVGDDPYNYRLSSNRAEDDDGLKLRLGVEPVNRPLTTDLDGTLKFGAGVPQFDGMLSVARPVGMALSDGKRVMSNPWQLHGKVRATAASASFEELALQYGPDERTVNFTGRAQLTFGAHPHLDGKVSAVELDVDRMLAAPDVTHRPPFILLKSFFETFVGAIKPPLPVKAGVNIEAMTVGGITLQSLRGNVGFDAAGWRLEDFAFHAPGLTDVKVSGRLDGGQQRLGFSGPVSLESSDLKMLMAWLEGRSNPPSGPAQTLSGRADIMIAGDRLALDRLSATLDRENVEGRLAYAWATAGRPAALEGELRAAKLDVDALLAFARAAASDDAFELPHKVALVLDIGRATLAGVDARVVDARVKLDTGVLNIDRFSVADLGGAALNVSGHIDELSSRPLGRLTLDVNATTLAGLAEVVGKFAPRVATAFRAFVDRFGPAKMHGALTVDHAVAGGSVAKLDLGGALGALRVSLNGEATGEPAHLGAARVRIASRFDADDSGALMRLLDLDRAIAVDQLPGQMTISANGRLDGDLQLGGVANAGGFSAAAQGTLHLSGEQAPSGSLQLKASAADLGPLQRTLTGQPGSTIPATASAIIGVAGAELSFTDLAMTVGKSSLRGRLDLKLASPVAINGEIAADDMDGAAVTASLLGLPSAAPGSVRPWSSAPVGNGAFGVLNGDVAFRLDRTAITPSLVARDLKGVLHFQPLQIVLSDLDGSLSGGHFTGELAFRRDAEKFTGQGRLDVAGANAADFVADRNALSGLLTLKLQGESVGLSPDGLIGALHGGGTITLVDGHFAGFDPAVFDAAMRAADQNGSIEPPKIAAVASAVIDKGRFAIPRADAEVTFASGQIRLANTTLQGQGGAELSVEGILDLNNASINAHLTLAGRPPANALLNTRPELAVTVKGPLAAPSRRVDVSTLVGWLTLRATEQQTRRLESIEANRREDALSRPLRPLPPFIRFIPQGTALETANHASALTPSFDPREFDRLRPEIPPNPSPRRTDGGATPAAAAAAVKPTVPQAATDKATATAGTASPVPHPESRSPLDLRPRSQN